MTDRTSERVVDGVPARLSLAGDRSRGTDKGVELQVVYRLERRKLGILAHTRTIPEHRPRV
jgi:hypothetical protein